jgi:uncharacterized membrane protein
MLLGPLSLLDLAALVVFLSCWFDYATAGRSIASPASAAKA